MSYPAPPVEPTTPVTVPPAPKHKRHPVLLTFAAFALFGFGTLVGSLGAGSDTTPPAAGKPIATAAPQPAAVASTPAEKPAVKPAVKDFKVAVKVTQKQCFGSAGCNVTFRIDPSYTGPAIPADQTYEVVYEIRGGDEPLRNRFTITGDTATYDQDEMIGTKTSKAVLTAIVVEVNEL